LPLLAVDIEAKAVEVYERNFQPLNTYVGDIHNLIDGRLGSQPTNNELHLLNKYLDNATPTLLLAGPPCQGYSSLNNFHRQKDVRNTLYERVGRFVELTEPESVIIENVPTVVHSIDNVVEKTIRLIESKGYYVDSGVINLVEIGVPQQRKRHIVIASKRKKVSISYITKKHKVETHRTFDWAAGDLQDEISDNILDTQTKHSKENIDRMTFLHSNGVYDLPDKERPKCHQKKHGYKSMYGRIKTNEPAQTITSGFTSPGQGRFTHPQKIRTLTPHEAARLQFIPDFFELNKCTSRGALSLMIGNAAPLKLSYVFCLELLT
jgi:DNA (cytosine-5)-methyltransferase 1